MSVDELGTPWVEGKTIGGVLRETAAHAGNREAVVFPLRGYRLSYADFDRQVDRAARGLLGLGLQRGDHLAVWATNCPEWVILQFATARVGVVLVTVNPAYRTAELEYTLRQSDAKALAMVQCFRDSNYFEMLGQLCPELATCKTDRVRVGKFPKLVRLISMCDQVCPGMTSWDGLLTAGATISDPAFERALQLPDPNDVINVQYTSGTTGFPKGAMLTHRNLLLNVYYAGACQKMTGNDRMCIPVPLYHCFGCVLATLCSAVYGVTMVFPNEFFHTERTLDAIEQERCTVLYGVPTMFIAQLEHPSFAGRNLSSLRTGIMAGAPCPLELMHKVTEVMGCREITIGYGQTEASPLITQTRADDPIELRVGTVGRPLPGFEVKIVDPVTGSTLPAGEPGELCGRGHGVMKGYYNMPEQTARAIDAEGWLHTGDLAVMQPDGYYRITGRLKDMIIRGGENIYPREIEEFLYTHPKIEEVQVLGVPDTKYGEQVLAWVKLRAGESASEHDIREFCRMNLAYFKVPKYITFVESFPMTVTGKIQKYKIREQAIQELGLEQAARVETA